MTYGEREGCPADRHDTIRAGQSHGCVCPGTREAERARCRRYRNGATGRAYSAARNAAERAERALWREVFGQGERERRVRALTLAGQSARVIGERLGVTSRTVQRIRAKLRTEGQLSS